MRCITLIVLFIIYSQCQVEGQIIKEEVCVACIDLSTDFFSVFENSNDTAAINAFINNTCSLFPKPIEQELCTDTLTFALDFFEDEADSFFNEYTPYSWCTLPSLCPCPCCSTNHPEQVHISVTGSPNEIVITWIQSKNATDAYVQYTVAGDSSQEKYTNVEVYTYWEGGWAGYIYSSVLTGLQPSTSYNYTVGTETYGSIKPGYIFTTPPPVNSQSNVTFAIYGDMGDTESSRQVMFVLQNTIHYLSVDLVLHVGDIAYTNGYQGVWDSWMRDMTPIFASTPYMAVEGNHESRHFSVPYLKRFRNPYQESGSPSPKYYSYDYGNVHFLAFTFEDFLDLDNNPEFGIQHAWIQQDLAKANSTRDATPWIIAYGHRPLYCSYHDDKRCIVEAARYRRQLEDLFYDYKVDMVISGHNHNYERTYPVYKRRPTEKDYNNPTAPVYAVIGSAGRGIDYGWREPAPRWSVKSSRITEWGFGVVDTYGSTQLEFRWIEAYTSQVMDSFTINKIPN